MTTSECAQGHQPAPRHGPPLTGLAVVVATSVLLVGATLLGNEAFFARDVLNYYWPLRTVWVEAVSQGHIPEWAPHAQSGLPLLGDIHAGALYPPHLLYLLMPFPTAYAWLFFIHHAALGLGMLVFLRRTLSEPAATGGAVALMLSGYVAGLGNAGPLLSGLAYVPWALWLISSGHSTWTRSGVLALLLAAQSLTGDPQSVVFSVLSCAVWLLWHGLPRDSVAVLFLGTALSGVVAAAQLVPAWEVLRESTRAAANSRFVLEFALHPLRLTELVAPFPLGRFADEPRFWAWFTVEGPGDWPFALSAYLGASAFVLVIVGARRSRAVAAGATLFLVGLLLALGERGGMGALLAEVPPFRFFRYPEKYLALASIGFAIVLASSLDGALRGGISRARMRSGFAVAGGLVAVALAGFALRAELGSWIAERLAPRGASSEDIVDALIPSAAHVVAVVLLAVGMAWAIRTFDRSRVLSGWLLVGLVGFDLLIPARALVMTAPAELYELTPPLAHQLTESAPFHPFRIVRDHMLRAAVDVSSTDDLIRKRALEVATLQSNVAGAFGLEEVAGYSGGFSLARWEAVALALYEDQARLGAVFNGCLVLTRVNRSRFASAPGFVKLGENELGVAVYRNEICPPRLHGVEALIPSRDLKDSLEKLKQPELDLRRQAIVEGDTGDDIEPTKVDLVSVSASHLSARVHAQEPGGYVVFATSYFPGWHARVDDVETPIRITNGATMGIRVPPGDHTVEFRFSHPGRWAGWLSLLGVAAAFAAIMKGRRSAVRAASRSEETPA